MKSFRTHQGIVAPLDRANIDTDAIIPKQFLKRIDRTGYGKFLFYDWRYNGAEQENSEFLLNREPYRNATVLLTRENFGCGSSREHAPWAIEDYGFRVIIAPSFADIFYNNCFKNGILPIRMPEEAVQYLFDKANEIAGYQLAVNLEEQRITDSEGYVYDFDVDEYRRHMLLQGLDEISATMQFDAEITDFELNHKIYYSR